MWAFAVIAKLKLGSLMISNYHEGGSSGFKWRAMNMFSKYYLNPNCPVLKGITYTLRGTVKRYIINVLCSYHQRKKISTVGRTPVFFVETVISAAIQHTPMESELRLFFFSFAAVEDQITSITQVRH